MLNNPKVYNKIHRNVWLGILLLNSFHELKGNLLEQVRQKFYDEKLTTLCIHEATYVNAGYRRGLLFFSLRFELLNKHGSLFTLSNLKFELMIYAF